MRLQVLLDGSLKLKTVPRFETSSVNQHFHMPRRDTDKVDKKLDVIKTHLNKLLSVFLKSARRKEHFDIRGS